MGGIIIYRWAWQCTRPISFMYCFEVELGFLTQGSRNGDKTCTANGGGVAKIVRVPFPPQLGGMGEYCKLPQIPPQKLCYYIYYFEVMKLLLNS